MGYWGKVIGGLAGFAIGGPLGAGAFGAVIGAAIGHAADSGAIAPKLFGRGLSRLPGIDALRMGHLRVAAMFGKKDQLWSIGVVVLAAKLAKCDGPVVRAEIDAFKRVFRIPPDSARDIGRLFNEARGDADHFEPYAEELGAAFADNRTMLEEVMRALFTIARADGPANAREVEYLRRVHRAFRLDETAWEQATGARPRFNAQAAPEDEAYAELGISRRATDEEARAVWLRLVRENHPDRLASRGVPPDFIAAATDRMARVNAAWDQIKRMRGL